MCEHAEFAHFEVLNGCNDVYAFALEVEYIMLQSVIDVIRT